MTEEIEEEYTPQALVARIRCNLRQLIVERHELFKQLAVMDDVMARIGFEVGVLTGVMNRIEDNK